MTRILKATALLVSIPLWANAQQPVKPGPKPYTYVEQMPTQPGGGGMAALVAAIQKSLKVPHVAGQPDWRKNMVYFIVGPDGKVYGAKIIKSSEVPAYDQALLTAVRKLPRFIPGRQGGQPVAVSFTVPMSICLQ